MNPQDSFYYFLPSDLDPDITRRYKAARFSLTVSPPLHLDENWEMGLAEIFYPRFKYNLLYPDNWLEVTYFKTRNVGGGISYLRAIKSRRMVMIPQGSYDPQNFARTVNKIFRKQFGQGFAKRGLSFSYDPILKKMKFHMHPGEGIYVKSEKLRRILGLKPSIDDDVGIHFLKLNYDAQKLRTDVPSGQVDMEVDGSDLMFVYTNLTRYNYVGRFMAPLLRIVNFRGDKAQAKSSTIHKIFKNIHYHKLRLTHINSIEVILTDQFGKDLAFVHGKTMLVVHFRRKKEDLKKESSA